MKTSQIKTQNEKDQFVIDLAMDYSERVRSYGDKADFVKIEDYLARLPEESRERFLQLVNLDMLASLTKTCATTGSMCPEEAAGPAL